MHVKTMLMHSQTEYIVNYQMHELLRKKPRLIRLILQGEYFPYFNY
jgi:hypothetical protein